MHTVGICLIGPIFSGLCPVLPQEAFRDCWSNAGYPCSLSPF